MDRSARHCTQEQSGTNQGSLSLPARVISKFDMVLAYSLRFKAPLKATLGLDLHTYLQTTIQPIRLPVQVAEVPSLEGKTPENTARVTSGWCLLEGSAWSFAVETV